MPLLDADTRCVVSYEDRLRDAVCVVTGAARGVGRGIALALGDAGATVYITDRDSRSGSVSPLPGTIEDTADDVTARGGRGIPVRVDHTVDAQVDALFSQVEAEHGGLHLLVANVFAGNELPFRGGPLWELPIAWWDLMFTAGVRAHLIAAHRAAGLLRASSRGLIVLTSFSDSTPVMAGNAIYDLAMTATNRLAHSLAHDFRPYGVTALALSPGFVRTEAVMTAIDEAPPDTQSPEYVGRAVVALATDPDVTRHTGQVLHVGALAKVYDFTDIDGTQPP